MGLSQVRWMWANSRGFVIWADRQFINIWRWLDKESPLSENRKKALLLWFNNYCFLCSLDHFVNFAPQFWHTSLPASWIFPQTGQTIVSGKDSSPSISSAQIKGSVYSFFPLQPAMYLGAYKLFLYIEDCFRKIPVFSASLHGFSESLLRYQSVDQNHT